jgi:hypothetical protein
MVFLANVRIRRLVDISFSGSFSVMVPEVLEKAFFFHQTFSIWGLHHQFV